jgi:leader peptidase (prepilin peptidase)/N-methyltransferase
LNVVVNDTVLAALLGLLVAGLGGLLVPALIASVPEPAPKEPKEPEAPEEDAPLA